MHSVPTMILTWMHRLLHYLPTSISSRIYGTLFGLRLGLNLPVSSTIYCKNNQLTSLTGEQIPAFVYTTFTPGLPTLSTCKNVRTIIVIHGMSATAHEDPRIVNFAQAFAASSPSNIVVVPYVKPLAVVDLSNDPIGAIRRSIELIANDKQLCPTGVISIASACISGGYSIVAASDLSAHIVIDGMFLVGAHADARNVMKDILQRKGKGDSRYALYAILSSYHHPKGGPLSKMLAAYVYDDHMKNVGTQTDQVSPLLNQYPEEAKEYKRITEDGDYACSMLEDLTEQFEKEIDDMSGLAVLDTVNVKLVSLIHSNKDEIVPPSESLILKDAWEKKGGMVVSCMITSLLNHGDQEPLKPSDISEILRMLDCFSTFFRKVKQTDSTKVS